MTVRPRNDDFTQHVNVVYEPETDVTCAICGYGIYRGDPILWDQEDEICHAECVEKEKENGSEETC